MRRSALERRSTRHAARDGSYRCVRRHIGSRRAPYLIVRCATFDVLHFSPLRSRPAILFRSRSLSRAPCSRCRTTPISRRTTATRTTAASRTRARRERCGASGATSASALPPRRCLGAASAPISARPRRCDLQPRRGLGADLSAVSARRPPTSAPASVSTSARAASARPRPARPRPHFLFVCEK